MNCANRKKICLIAFHYDEYVLELKSALQKRCNLKCILVTKKRIAKERNLVTFQKPRIRNVYRNIKILYKINKIISDYKPSVIHFQSDATWFSILLRFLYKNYKIVHTIHDVTAHSGEKKWWIEITENDLRKHSDRFIVHGKSLKKELLQRHKWIKSKQVYVIPHGPLSTYTQKNPKTYDEKKNRILFFGRIHKYKGLEYLVKAEPKISQKVKKLKIIIAGHGPELERCKRKIVNIEHFEIIDKYINDNEIPKLFQESSVVVLPYTDASQSGIIPIAYEYKKPVIVTNVGSIPEVVDHEKTGLIVEPKNTRELACAIIELLLNKKKRNQMGINAHQKLMTELNWEKIADDTIKVYES